MAAKKVRNVKMGNSGIRLASMIVAIIIVTILALLIFFSLTGMAMYKVNALNQALQANAVANATNAT
jgi:hypothetical protein